MLILSESNIALMLRRAADQLFSFVAYSTKNYLFSFFTYSDLKAMNLLKFSASSGSLLHIGVLICTHLLVGPATRSRAVSEACNILD